MVARKIYSRPRTRSVFQKISGMPARVATIWSLLVRTYLGSDCFDVGKINFEVVGVRPKICVGRHSCGKVRVVGWDENAELRIGSFCSIASDCHDWRGPSHGYYDVCPKIRIDVRT